MSIIVESKDNTATFEKILKVSEDTFKSIINIHSIIYNQSAMLFMSTIGLYFSSLLTTVALAKPHEESNISESTLMFMIAAALLGLGSAYSAIQCVRQILESRRILAEEENMLLKLLSMAHEFKDNLLNANVGLVKREVFEMRLKRILIF